MEKDVAEISMVNGQREYGKMGNKSNENYFISSFAYHQLLQYIFKELVCLFLLSALVLGPTLVFTLSNYHQK